MKISIFIGYNAMYSEVENLSIRKKLFLAYDIFLMDAVNRQLIDRTVSFWFTNVQNNLRYYALTMIPQLLANY